LEILAEGGLEIDRGEMRWAPWPRMAERHLLRVRVEPGDQLAQIFFWLGLVGDEQLMIARQRCDRLEVLHEVILQWIDRAVDDMGPEIAEHDGVAVWRCAYHAAGRDAAGSARDVLDHDWLAERLAHALGENTGEHGRPASRRDRHHHGDWPPGIGRG